MGNLIRIPGLKTKDSSRIVRAERLNINAHNPQQGAFQHKSPEQGAWWFNSKITELPDEWPSLNNLTISYTGWTGTCRTVVIEKPSGLVGICGCSPIGKRVDAYSNVMHYIPFCMGTKDGNFTSHDGMRYYIVTTKNSIPSGEWADIIDYNCQSNSVTKYMEWLGVDVEHVMLYPSNEWVIGLFRWAAIVPDDVTVLAFSWVLPTSKTNIGTTSEGGPTYGVGVTDPNIYLLYE